MNCKQLLKDYEKKRERISQLDVAMDEGLDLLKTDMKTAVASDELPTVVDFRRLASYADIDDRLPDILDRQQVCTTTDLKILSLFTAKLKHGVCNFMCNLSDGR